jgi:hypothetical protein
MPTALRDVRSQGQSGKHMLALSFSGFDPGCAKTCTRGDCAELFSLFSPSTVPARAVLFLFNVIETNVLRESLTSEFSHSLDPSQTWTPRPGTAGSPQFLRCPATWSRDRLSQDRTDTQCRWATILHHQRFCSRKLSARSPRKLCCPRWRSLHCRSTQILPPMSRQRRQNA